MNITNKKHFRKFRIIAISALLLFMINMQFLNISFAQEDSDETFYDAFPLQTFDSRFYILHLNASDTINLNITAAYKGDFDVFIYNFRPYDVWVGNGGYWSGIYEEASAYDVGTGDVIDFEFVAPKNGMYYIQVVLIANGTDTFYLNSTHHLELYFIPFILPGFPVEMTMLFSVAAVFLLWSFVLKKRLKLIK